MNDIHDADCGCQEYNELSRRQFITGAAAVSAATMFPAWLPKIVMSKNFASNRDIIVSIFQRGGADGLSIAVPFADANYYSSRSTIAIPQPDSSSPNKGINLDGFFMFPQAMAGLVPAFQAQDLLIVHATGQLNVSRSHFDAQRYMEVGKPIDPSLVTGWLGRHLASIPPLVPTAPLRGIGVASGLQKTLVGGPHTLPIADPTNYTIGGSATTQAARIAYHAERVRHRRRAGALGRARRDEHDRPAQVRALSRRTCRRTASPIRPARSARRCARWRC